MKTVVMDTSAIIRFYVPDGPVPDKLNDSIAAAWRAEISLLVPELALAEVTQVLLKKERLGFITQTEADEIFHSVLELPFEVYGHYDLLPDALSIARQYNLTVYDALFLALAIKKSADLITADQKLSAVFEEIQKTPYH